MKTLLLIVTFVCTTLLATSQPISDWEKTSILQMREEEKMARDLYIILHEKWDRQVFSNITRSEEYHMAQMKLLIDTFKLQDPVLKNNDARGIFENKSLQKMYDELTITGKESLEAAFRAGAKVEEVDIKDLKEAISDAENTSVKSTFQYLLFGSENHIRAFVRNLKRMGITYSPVILSMEEFNKIIDN